MSVSQSQRQRRAAEREREARMHELKAKIRARHPRFVEAVLADTRITSQQRGRPLHGRSRRRVAVEAIRLAWQSDGFLAQAMYRAKARAQALGIPVLPRLLHRMAISTSGIFIGDPVVVAPGIHLTQGQVVIDGIVEVGARTTIFPFVTIGLRAGSVAGPRIGTDVTIGSGAKVIGDVSIGDRAKIGANAVVVDDVPPGTTVVGVPAQPRARNEGPPEPAPIDPDRGTRK